MLNFSKIVKKWAHRSRNDRLITRSFIRKNNASDSLELGRKKRPSNRVECARGYIIASAYHPLISHQHHRHGKPSKTNPWA